MRLQRSKSSIAGDTAGYAAFSPATVQCFVGYYFCQQILTDRNHGACIRMQAPTDWENRTVCIMCINDLSCRQTCVALPRRVGRSILEIKLQGWYVHITLSRLWSAYREFLHNFTCCVETSITCDVHRCVPFVPLFLAVKLDLFEEAAPRYGS